MLSNYTRKLVKYTRMTQIQRERISFHRWLTVTFFYLYLLFVQYQGSIQDIITEIKGKSSKHNQNVLQRGCHWDASLIMWCGWLWLWLFFNIYQRCNYASPLANSWGSKYHHTLDHKSLRRTSPTSPSSAGNSLISPPSTMINVYYTAYSCSSQMCCVCFLFL